MPGAARLFAALVLLLPASGCHFRGDPFYAKNRDLIDILDRADRRPAPGKYLVAGAGGQDFYLEDIRAAVVKWHLGGRQAAAFAAFAARLRARGIRLLLVPAPSKAETYPELLVGRATPRLSPAKDAFLADLDRRGVEYLDLRDGFFRAKSRARLFPRGDSHWDQPAVSEAAGALAARLDNLGMAQPLRYGSRDTALPGWVGDVALKYRAAGARPPDTLRLRAVLGPDGRPYREPDTAAVLVFGDSFAGQYRAYGAHLGAQLAYAMGLPVRTVSGLRAYGGDTARADSAARACPGLKVLVWVFASRALMCGPPG